MSEIEFHEYANLFPMMSAAEFAELVDDMRANGYDETAPIVLYQEYPQSGECKYCYEDTDFELAEPIYGNRWSVECGKCGGRPYASTPLILDGRNRYRAALEAGVKPVFVNYDGDDPLGFVIRHNLKRRHLNESQRAVVAARLANMTRGGVRPGQNTATSQTANLQFEVTQSAAADMLNVSPRTVATIKAIERAAPELLPRIEAGEMTAHEAQKTIRANEIKAYRAEIAEVGALVEKSERWNIYQGDIRTWKAPRQYDFIITDPPYPREFLPLWEVLAQRAKEWLKPGGLLIAMSGQSYLDEIYAMMSGHLKYWWTGCYLVPGGQAVQVFPRKAIPYWKPLLIYCNGEYSGKWFGDVAKSPANNNEKDAHDWGQSVSGMSDILERFSDSGSYILDPFCGSGTTGLAAIKHGCFFDGLDIDDKFVNISKGRLSCQK